MKSEIIRTTSRLASAAVITCAAIALVMFPLVELGRRFEREDHRESFGVYFDALTSTLKAENLAVSNNASVGGVLTVGSCVGCGGGGGFATATGSFASFTLTASATGNSIVSVTNPGADSVINLADLGVTPTTGQILVISVPPTSTGGFAVITGGTPTGTKKAFAGASSTAPAGSAIWVVYNGTQWSPLSATPGQLLQVTNSIITQGSIAAAGNIQATQLLLGGGLRVQACIVPSNIGASASVDLNSTGEGQVYRLFLNAQSGSGGSIGNITNSFVTPTGGQGLEITNSSAFPVTLNGAAGGTGQIILPASLSSLVVQPGQTVFADYDSGNELGHGSNVWYVQGWSSATAVFASGGGFWGKAGVLLVNEASGNISTAGSISASASITGAAIVASGGPSMTTHILGTGTVVSLTNATCASSSCTDVAGTVTTTSTSMIITFAGTYTGADDAGCILQEINGTAVPTFQTSATALTATTVVNGVKYHYICMGH